MAAIEQPNDNTPHSAALQLAALGLRVLPIKPGHKRPPMDSWQHAATHEPDKVSAWYTGLYRTAGVGLALGPQPNGNYLFAVDIDLHDPNANGFDTLHDLEHEHGELPETWTAITGSDGGHRIFAAPPGVIVRNQQAAGQRLGPGIDIRGDGGQIVVAPTLHPDTGRAYAWEHGYAPWERPVATAPAWLVALVQEPEPKASPPNDPFLTPSSGSDSIAEDVRNWWDWNHELTTRGWTQHHTDGADTYWVRPGKDRKQGHSAVQHGDTHIVVFTTDIPATWTNAGVRTTDGSGWSFSPFGFYAATEHDGDRSQAAKALRNTTNTQTTGIHTSDDDQQPIELIDWATIHDHGDEIVPGLLMPGRWTSLAAGAKAGKTTLEMFLTIEISEGRDPFDGNPIEPVVVLYVDAEMGRLDLEERIHDLGHPDPLKLTRWYATDMPPRLDTIPGGNALQLAVQQLGAQVVVIDGINGTVTGAEKDDMTWRAFYDYSIFPLKRLGVSIITGDNYGKDETLGPRGSSVKMDKPDAVIRLNRTDNGVKLTTTHRRTSAYPLELLLSIDGLNGDVPISYRRTNTKWMVGTEKLAAKLDDLGIPTDWGRGKVKQALVAAGETSGTTALAEAIRYRKLHPRIASFDLDSGGQVGGQVETDIWTVPADSSPDNATTREDSPSGQVWTGDAVMWTVGGCSETDTPTVQTTTDHDNNLDNYTADDLFGPTPKEPS